MQQDVLLKFQVCHNSSFSYLFAYSIFKKCFYKKDTVAKRTKFPIWITKQAEEFDFF